MTGIAGLGIHVAIVDLDLTFQTVGIYPWSIFKIFVREIAEILANLPKK